jgi:hypothetical protein
VLFAKSQQQMPFAKSRRHAPFAKNQQHMPFAKSQQHMPFAKSRRHVPFAKSRQHMPFAKSQQRGAVRKKSRRWMRFKKSQGHMPFAKLSVSLELSWMDARRLPPGITGGSSRGEIRRWLSASKLGGLALCRRPMPLNMLACPWSNFASNAKRRAFGRSRSIAAAVGTLMTERISTMLLTASSEVSIMRSPISTSTGSSGLGEIKIRYLETRRLADGSTAYYYHPPKPAQKAGIALSEALGKDPVAAAARAEEQNKRIDDWRAGKDEGGGQRPRRINRLADRKVRGEPPIQTQETSDAGVLQRRAKSLARVQTQVQARKLSPAHVDSLYLELQKIEPKTDEPTQLPWANAIMRSARRIFNLGIRWGYVTANPFAHMELSEAPARETVIPRDHVDLFCATAIAIGRRSMALWARLSYELCQRAGDARSLPWSRYNGREVQVKQGKTSALVWAPLLPDLPELKDMLDETPRVSTIIVIDEKTKQPYTIYNLSKAFNEVRDAAGLPTEYQARDMRRAGMDETGDAGATDDELRSLSGHKDRNVVHVYVKPNRRKAANALAKRRAHRSEKRTGK